MLSGRQQRHLERLNSLPQTKSRRFSNGHAPHNKRGWIVTVPCSTCGKATARTNHQLQRNNRHYCSRICATDGKPSPKADQALELYNSGLKIREIAEKFGCTVGSVASILYRKKLKGIYQRKGYGRQAARAKLPKHCELCGYDRTVDIAHIVPVRDGGTYALSNCYALCPNCHHLFDHGQLTRAELAKLEGVHYSRNE